MAHGSQEQTLRSRRDRKEKMREEARVDTRIFCGRNTQRGLEILAS